MSQQRAAGVEHERVSEVDVAVVHLQLHVTELRVVHHAAQISAQPGHARLRRTAQSKTNRDSAFILKSTEGSR